MNGSISWDHPYIPHLQNAHQDSVIQETVTFFSPVCMTLWDTAVVAPALISMKQTFAALWHSPFDKCDNSTYPSALTELTGGGS